MAEVKARIPKSVTLPFGYEITVVRGGVDGDAWGDYDEETRTILLDEGLKKPAQARYIFLHEMEHAWKEWLKYVATKISVENPDGPAEEPANGDTEEMASA